jgi:hypothetical protein
VEALPVAVMVVRASIALSPRRFRFCATCGGHLELAEDLHQPVRVVGLVGARPCADAGHVATGGSSSMAASRPPCRRRPSPWHRQSSHGGSRSAGAPDRPAGPPRWTSCDRAERSGSVVEAWVSLVRLWPWKSRPAPSAGASSFA